MNSGIVISFIIGGLLLISILSLNARVSENSGEAVLNMSAKQTVETVTKIMSRDFLRIGYNTGDPADAIISTSSQRIVFLADINNDSNSDPVQITWNVQPGDPISATENPNDYKLTRTVSAGPESGPPATFAVTDFSFSFFDVNGSPTTNPSSVRTIKITMETEAPDKYANRTGYEKSLWKKTFTPPNLNFRAYNN